MIRIIRLSLAFISLALGIAGIFLPLLPTTPFLLLSAAFFAKSSEKYYNKLIDHKTLGPYIKNFRENRSIPLRVKIVSVSLLWITILCSAFFAVEKIAVRILLIAIAIGVSIHILSYKTKK